MNPARKRFLDAFVGQRLFFQRLRMRSEEAGGNPARSRHCNQPQPQGHAVGSQTFLRNIGSFLPDA
jgi:hypothetical protein